jgi:S-adenosyl-L-methionine hydrolase (adenosine-forming)
VVLLTDFGPQSPYVGQMKLVLARLAPRSAVLDLAHDLPPQNPAAAALVLSGSRPFLPVPCVVCVVVDPGVGSARRILVARYAGGLQVIAPDNGILPALRSFGPPAAIREVTNRGLFLPAVSPVFHGRDVFAPVAARLAAGLAPARVGPPARPSSLARPAWRAPRMGTPPRGVEVLYADRFGDLVTNLHAEDLRGAPVRSARCAKRRFPFVTHYAAVAKGQPLCLIGSFGHLELALREKSAAAELDAAVGAEVLVELGGQRSAGKDR